MAQIHHLHRVTVSACTQKCEQGRECTCQPEAAEPCTDLGADDLPPRLRPIWSVLLLLGGWPLVAALVSLCMFVAEHLPLI